MNPWILGLIVLLPMVSTPSQAAKILKYSEEGTPTTLDPAQSATTYSNLIVTAIYDTLYEYKYLKIPYELKPNLAESMPIVSKDGLTYKIPIKKGVYFSDDPAFKNGKGREVIAEDFIYSIKRHFDVKNRSQGSWLWRGRIEGLDEWKENGSNYLKDISGLKALNRYTISITLKKPFPQLVYTLAMGFSAVVPKEVIEKYGKEVSVHPVGSGPFILKSFNPQRALLARNPNYRKEVLQLEQEGFEPSLHKDLGIKELAGKTLPIVDQVEVNFIKQSVARWNSFTKGNEVQYAEIPTAQVDQILSNKDPITLKKPYSDKYFFRSSPEFGFVYSGFNMSHPDFGYSSDPEQNKKNKALRCAIRKSFNWKQRINRFYYGIGKPFPGVIPPQLKSYSKMSDESIQLDVKEAKKILKEAGWNKKNLPTFLYSGVSTVKNKQFFEQFRGFLKRIGYPRHKVKFKQYATFGDYNKALKKSELPFISLGWGLDYPDAENLMQLFYGPNGSPGSNNTNYKNPEFDKLYEQTSSMIPSAKRAELYKKMTQILIDDCVLISGFSRTKIFVWHKNTAMYPSRSPHGNLFKYFDVK